MNEESKTGVYWVVALAMAAVATFVAWPTTIESPENQQVGKPLFENFDDPLVAASMKIVTFDAEQSAISDFEVAKDANGVWKIPTHAGYTADAETQMQKAATLFLDNTILDVSTTNREDHADFGVLDPTSAEVKVGSAGVGRLVTIKDNKGTTLISLVVGNEVEDHPGQRYVRRPGQDIVYAVELDDAALTTKFTDWIERDLLQLAPFDITGVTLKNYTTSLDAFNRTVLEDREFDAELKVNGSDWQLERLVTYQDGTSVPRPLNEGEKLNAAKLNELKQALDELKIADVGRKPAGMSANLKASKDMLSDESAMNSLLSRGFIPAGREGSEETEILAANGEIAVSMKDGVRYILRFGNVAGLSEAEQEAAGSDEAGLVGSNRYMLVTTEVDESIVPLPALQPVPQSIEELDAPAEPAEEPAADAPEQAAAETDADAEMTELSPPTNEEPATEEPATEEPATEEPATEEPATEEPATEEPATEEPTTEEPASEEPATEDPTTEEPATEEPATEEPATEEPATEEPATEEPATEEPATEEPTVEEVPPAEEPSEESPVTEQNDEDASLCGPQQDAENDDAAEAPQTDAADADATDEPAQEADPAAAVEPAASDDAADPPAAAPEETEQEKQERLEAAQERITKENQRKLDEREEKLKAAREHVAELNARFADWYYEISESTFSKLHLGLDELIVAEGEQPSTPGADPAAGLPQFNFPGGPGN